MPSLALAQFHREPPSMRVLRWIIVPLLAVHVVLATYSGYRAVVQVYSVDIVASSPVIRPGTTVDFSAASSGRVPVSVIVELIQGAQHDTLAFHLIRDHGVPSYDPRTIRVALGAAVTAQHLEKFTPGPAILRITGLGRMQWLRTPPPKVRDVHVIIAP